MNSYHPFLISLFLFFFYASVNNTRPAWARMSDSRPYSHAGVRTGEEKNSSFGDCYFEQMFMIIRHLKLSRLKFGERFLCYFSS